MINSDLQYLFLFRYFIKFAKLKDKVGFAIYDEVSKILFFS